jgi:phospholipase/carboxylesterase
LPALWGELIARAVQLDGVFEGHSSVSPAPSRALLLTSHSEINAPETSLSPREPLEPVHIHGVTDTSTHLCLPVKRANEVCELGWGEVHPFGDFGTEIMVYGPRDEEELEVILSIIDESLKFARTRN